MYQHKQSERRYEKKARLGNAIAESLPAEERSGSASTGRHRSEKTQLFHHLSHHFFSLFPSWPTSLFFGAAFLLLCLIISPADCQLFCYSLLKRITNFCSEWKKKKKDFFYTLCVSSPPALFVLISPLGVMSQFVWLVFSFDRCSGFQILTIHRPTSA